MVCAREWMLLVACSFSNMEHSRTALLSVRNMEIIGHSADTRLRGRGCEWKRDPKEKRGRKVEQGETLR